MKAALYRNFSTATDMADYLARKGVPFREAHEIVGSLVRHCETTSAGFFDITVEKLREFSPEFGDDAAGLLNPETSPERKLSPGSTAKEEIKKQIAVIKEMLKVKPR